MTGTRLLRLFSRKSSASSDAGQTENPVQAPLRDRPVPRPLSYWAVCAALCLLAAGSVWLVAAGLALAHSASRVAGLEFRAPTFEDYVATLPNKPKIPHVEIAPLTAAEAAAVEMTAMVKRAFESVREFENGRAEARLVKLRPVLSGVEAGSPAQLAGFQQGDEIASIWGKPVASIWELFVTMDVSAASSAEVELKRAGTLYKATLSSHSGVPLDVVVSGMLFDIPEGVLFIGTRQMIRAANDFIRDYVEAVPPDWRKTYAASLDLVMRGLAKRLNDQKGRSANDPGFLSHRKLLPWHHTAFLAEMERLRIDTQRAIRAQGAALLAFGQAATGVALALLLSVLALWRHSRTPRRVSWAT